MSCNVQFSGTSLADLKKLTPKNRERISKKIKWIAQNCEVLEHESLTGEFTGSLKYRVGDYRVIYYFNEDEKLIEILRVGHRRDVYR